MYKLKTLVSPTPYSMFEYNLILLSSYSPHQQTLKGSFSKGIIKNVSFLYLQDWSSSRLISPYFVPCQKHNESYIVFHLHFLSETHYSWTNLTSLTGKVPKGCDSRPMKSRPHMHTVTNMDHLNAHFLATLLFPILYAHRLSDEHANCYIIHSLAVPCPVVHYIILSDSEDKLPLSSNPSTILGARWKQQMFKFGKITKESTQRQSLKFNSGAVDSIARFLPLQVSEHNPWM